MDISRNISGGNGETKHITITNVTDLNTILYSNSVIGVTSTVPVNGSYTFSLETLPGDDTKTWIIQRMTTSDTVTPATYQRTYSPLTSAWSAWTATVDDLSNYVAKTSLVKTYPELSYYERVLAALGSSNKEDLHTIYMNYLNELPVTKLLLDANMGVLERTSGLNVYGKTLFDASPNNSDATQPTDAIQPFMAVTAAPNAKKALRFVQGQTQTGLMDHPDVSFQATDAWTYTTALKVNKKGNARIYLDPNSYINIGTSSISLFVPGGGNILGANVSLECGKTYIIQFEYNNGTGLIRINNIPYITTAGSGAVTFSYSSYSSTYPFDGSIYHIHLQSGVKSAYQSNLDYTMLRAFYPEIESANIGNQCWATDNLAVSVDGAGNTINEVQGATTDGNPELITNHTFDTSDGWVIAGESTISGGVARLYSSTGVNSYISTTTNILTIGKWYRLTYDVISKSGGFALAGNSIGAMIIETTVGNNKTSWFKAVDNSFNIKRGDVGLTDITFDNIYVKEAGWSDSTLIYNQVYAATSGGATNQGRVACIAAGMWCHYNNDPAMGAIYGKLYNYYAAKMLFYNPISGWRIPSSADFTQLQTYEGGSTVAGGKLKAKFGGFDNIYASNESGFSGIAGGFRDISGLFSSIGCTIWSNDRYRCRLLHSDSTFDIGIREELYGLSLRLLRNSPVGPDTREISTNWINTNFATGTNVDLPIPFGYKVTGARVNSKTTISALQAVLYTSIPVAAKETLITGKTINTVDTPISFSVPTDQTILLQDGFVRFNGTKAVTTEYMMLTVFLEKIYKDTTL